MRLLTALQVLQETSIGTADFIIEGALEESDKDDNFMSTTMSTTIRLLVPPTSATQAAALGEQEAPPGGARVIGGHTLRSRPASPSRHTPRAGSATPQGGKQRMPHGAASSPWSPMDASPGFGAGARI